jgi:hypothetical protein
MDDSFCQDFFLRPTLTAQRHYEALRAYFVHHQPLTEIAQAFGFAYGTLRNLVAAFRAQCRAGQVPPFSSNRHADGPTKPGQLRNSRNPKPPSAPITASLT